MFRERESERRIEREIEIRRERKKNTYKDY
jgi:hypothetical protein